MSREVNEAIKLLRSNGYIVKEITKIMKKDSDKCEKLLEQGKDMDCCECSCSICIMQ